ncbi:MAG: sulfurtransferase [Holophagaceae bacterium]|nr:sulfurtransferase [Holophagaceae bacterium]
MSAPILAAAELLEDLQAFILLDARPREEYLAGHLPGARHADLERDLSAASREGHDPARGGRHPLPSLREFCATVGAWGIDDKSRVVVYDGAGGANAAARAWWMLRSLGLPAVQVLDGGLQAALAAGLHTTVEVPVFQDQEPCPAPRWQSTVVELDIVEKLAQHPAWKVLDVRSGERFRGETEPFDPAAGHIPGARNLPYGENLEEDCRFKSREALQALYGGLMDGLRPDHLVVHCGSGVTACHTLLALEHAGFHGPDGSAPALFVGSWSEWCRSGKAQAQGPG